MVKKIIVIYCFLTLQYNLVAQMKNFDIQTLWKLGRVSLEDLSTDGKWIIYSVTNYNTKENKSSSNLYLISSKGTSPAKKLTNYDGHEYNARFRPDGKKINFLHDALLYEMNLDGSDQIKISDIEMNGFVWSPKGDKIVFLQDVKYRKSTTEVYPDLPLAKARIYSDLMYRHWSSYDDAHDSNVFYVDCTNGEISSEPINIVNEAFEAPTEPNDGIEQVSVSPDGRYIAYSIKKFVGIEYALNTNSDIILYDTKNKSSFNVSESNKGYDKTPSFSPDGSKLIFNSMLTPGYEADKNRISLYDIKTKTCKDLTESYDNDMEESSFSSDGSFIYFVSAINGCKQILKYNLSTNKIEQLTKGTFDITSYKSAENVLVASKVSMIESAEIYNINVVTGDLTQISNVNTDTWSEINKPTVQSKWVKTTDGKDMLVWYILPPGFDKTKKYPTLLYCQGGPQSTLSQFFSYRWNFSLMASNGYVIIAPCRRGMPGFGQNWNQSISKDWGGQCMKDYLTAIDDACKESYVDKTKLGAVGASFGGYSVFYLAGNHNKRFKCFIAHCGMFNMESWYGTTEEMWFANYDIGGPYWDKKYKAQYDKFSPHKFVQNWDTPILVIHGEKDYRVPVSEGLQAFQAAQLKGIPSKLLLFPEEGHWIQSAQNGILWQREFYSWLDKYLK
ncbi:MAG: S9 family peptidase [Saprospiraceae bacterium]|nr:S9 family peptidase [Saprospiraceae bacterium]